jgi:hypothetical protein
MALSSRLAAQVLFARWPQRSVVCCTDKRLPDRIPHYSCGTNADTGWLLFPLSGYWPRGCTQCLHDITSDVSEHGATCVSSSSPYPRRRRLPLGSVMLYQPSNHFETALFGPIRLPSEISLLQWIRRLSRCVTPAGAFSGSPPPSSSSLLVGTVRLVNRLEALAGPSLCRHPDLHPMSHVINRVNAYPSGIYSALAHSCAEAENEGRSAASHLRMPV